MYSVQWIVVPAWPLGIMQVLTHFSRTDRSQKQKTWDFLEPRSELWPSCDLSILSSHWLARHKGKPLTANCRMQSPADTVISSLFPGNQISAGDRRRHFGTFYRMTHRLLNWLLDFLRVTARYRTCLVVSVESIKMSGEKRKKREKADTFSFKM